jgi:predicted RND superfamily exporter protein
MRVILPAILAVAALLSLFAFRTLRGVALVAASIAIALIWTLGAMGHSGASLNLVSNIVPPLIITLAFAATVHVVSEYYESVRQRRPVGRAEHDGAVASVLAEMGLAVGVNGFTTALGFLSLAVSRVSAIREFGVWSVVGVVATTLVALTFVPAALVALGPARRTPLPAEGGRIDAIADGLARFDTRWRRWIFAAAIALLAVSLAGATRLRVANDYVSSFAATRRCASTEAINARLGGANSFMIVVDADEDYAFARPRTRGAARPPGLAQRAEIAPRRRSPTS